MEIVSELIVNFILDTTCSKISRVSFRSDWFVLSEGHTLKFVSASCHDKFATVRAHHISFSSMIHESSAPAPFHD